MSKNRTKTEQMTSFFPVHRVPTSEVQSHAAISVMIKASAASLSQKGNYGL